MLTDTYEININRNDQQACHSFLFYNNNNNIGYITFIKIPAHR